MRLLPFRRARYSMNFGGLFDNNSVLLTISTNPAVLVFLQECTPASYYVGVINYPHHPDPFFLATLPPRRYPEWSWTRGKETGLVQTPDNLIGEAARAQSVLLTKKAEALTHIMQSLTYARQKLWTGVTYQETVYEAKRREAEQFKASGYDESILPSCMYVLQYAEFADISPRQAADDILLKSTFDHDILRKTELLRLKHFNKVRTATTVEEVHQNLEQFARECYRNALV